eukprot:TRINITY_DN1475_c0_g1_i2.p2 TRINITY_DN1475_c0_g1~~TRINITY_DN1475_c0_g1_i2.p2  ORF type:complete len:134 (-),score=47.99 TRINITY_DN1475_c0_g1_i2:225-626(-)
MEEYQIMQEQWIRESQGFIVVYSSTNEDSFYEVKQIIKRIERVTKSKTSPVLLVANKKDLADQRVVSVEEGKALAAEFSIPFLESSALTGEGIQEIFNTLIRDIRQRNGIVPQKTKRSGGFFSDFFEKFCQII